LRKNDADEGPGFTGSSALAGIFNEDFPGFFAGQRRKGAATRQKPDLLHLVVGESGKSGWKSGA
jgi:hypothetical protein